MKPYRIFCVCLSWSVCVCVCVCVLVVSLQSGTITVKENEKEKEAWKSQSDWYNNKWSPVVEVRGVTPQWWKADQYCWQGAIVVGFLLLGAIFLAGNDLIKFGRQSGLILHVMSPPKTPFSSRASLCHLPLTGDYAKDLGFWHTEILKKVAFMRTQLSKQVLKFRTFLSAARFDTTIHSPMLPRSFRSPSVKQSLQDRTDIWRNVTI